LALLRKESAISDSADRGAKRQVQFSYLKIICHPAYYILYKIRDSSVGIALGYELDDRGSRVRFPAGAGNFSLYHRVQNGSGAHAASYPTDTRGSFPGGKAAEA
jgi:hypothetical protein